MVTSRCRRRVMAAVSVLTAVHHCTTVYPGEVVQQLVDHTDTLGDERQQVTARPLDRHGRRPVGELPASRLSEAGTLAQVRRRSVQDAGDAVGAQRLAVVRLQ